MPFISLPALTVADFARPDRVITPAELESWIVEEDEDFICFNKPGWVVCHPAKNGDWSCLVGAARDARGWATAYLVSRLDRETSGVILIAKHREAAMKAQTAIADREVSKTYLAILEGEMSEPVHVDKPMGQDKSGRVKVKQYLGNKPGAQNAVTFFEPVHTGGGYTLARVELHTGRKHQIRVHAQSLGHAVVGDKLYGPDETLYLDFTESGWGARHDAMLPLPRQALHAARAIFKSPDMRRTFRAPLPGELRDFLTGRMGMTPEAVARAELLED